MPHRTAPRRHWRGHGDEPLQAFPSWFLRIECDRCGKVQMVNEAHARWRARSLCDIIARMRHDGCGGLAGKAELLTGIAGVSSRPVRRIALRDG
jgi:ribosomal protein S27E